MLQILGNTGLSGGGTCFVELRSEVGLSDGCLEEGHSLRIDHFVEHLFGDLAEGLARRLVRGDGMVDRPADHLATLGDESTQKTRFVFEQLVEGGKRAARATDD